MYIVLAVIAFGFLIAVHELGHFTAAKLLGVRVNEFAIGMGPKLLKKQGTETLYTLRLLPFGGFCAMGEDDGITDDPRAFTTQKGWARFLILFAGSAANFIIAFIIIMILTSGLSRFGGTTIVSLDSGFPNQGENGIMAGDTILSINGEKLYYREDFSLFMGLAEHKGDKTVNLVIKRGDTKITRDSFPMERREFIVNGKTEHLYGITFSFTEATPLSRLNYSFYQAGYFVRMVRVSLAQLFTGAAGLKDMSGPVGIVDTMNTIGQEAAAEYGVGEAIRQIVYFVAFIGVNLAVMNMLPIPALDGGRILFIFITFVIEKLIRRRLNPKYEGYIHTGAMVLLLGFMVLVLVNDIIRLAGR